MAITDKQNQRNKVLKSLKKAWLKKIYLVDHPTFNTYDAKNRAEMNKAWSDFRARHGFPAKRRGSILTKEEAIDRAAKEVQANADEAFGEKTAAAMKRAVDVIRKS